MRRISLRVVRVVLVVIFFACVPCALYYNQHFDRFGTINREKEPIFMYVSTVNCGRFEGTARVKASEYMRTNSAVTIFVNSLSLEQSMNDNWDVKLVREESKVYAFVAPYVSGNKYAHAVKYIEVLSSVEGFVVEIKVLI